MHVTIGAAAKHAVQSRPTEKEQIKSRCISIGAYMNAETEAERAGPVGKGLEALAVGGRGPRCHVWHSATVVVD